MWQKMIMVYLAISIGCAFWQPAIVFDNASTPLDYFDIDKNDWNTTKNIGPSSNVSGAIGRASQEGVNQEEFSSNLFAPLNFIIDPTYAVIKFVQLFFNILFAPINIMVAGQFPTPLIYMLGIPLVLMMLVAIAGWIKQ